MDNVEQLKQLREETAAPMQECRRALEEAKGDIEKAKEILRKWGKVLAGKKVEREAKDGLVDVYLHPNKKIGVMLEIRCESDFVARSEDFQNLSHEICLQVAATSPAFIGVQDVPLEFIAKEKAIYQEQTANSGKPPQIIEQIVEGKWKKTEGEICLLEQPWIKDETKKIKDLITENVAKLGENIVIKRFSRFSIR